MRATEEIERAVDVLRAGGLVAFPTETVYGLGADASNPAALRRMYAVKGRPSTHPVIVHLGDPEQLDEFARDVPDDARALALSCWPGPLTVIVLRDPARVCGEATGGLDTVGLRVPDQPLALELLRAFGGAIAAPSANRFGRVSPTSADHVRADLDGDVDLILDGGPCAVGVESTIVDCSGTEPSVLRLGGVPLERVAELLGRPVGVRDAGQMRAPGTLAAHYAPRAQVVVVGHTAVAARASQHLAAGRRVGLLALAARVPDVVPEGLAILKPPGDDAEYARVLYARLREADQLGLDVLLAVPPPTRGLGAAVADRLRRAAAAAAH